MKSSKERLIDIFNDIKAQGWVQSHRVNNTGIGKTFEDLAGIVENNSQGPDFEEFEIKSHRGGVSSPITLFTLAPSFPRRANGYLKDRYGEAYPDNPALKKLHTSMFANRRNSYAGRYAFKLINDREAEEIRIGVYNSSTEELIDDSVGYTYSKLRAKLSSKLNNLFYVSAERRFLNGVEEFKFTDGEIYTSPSFEQFLDVLDAGLVQYDIRIGSYQSGSKYGKPHDHGSGFRLREDHLHRLYADHEALVSADPQ